MDIFNSQVLARVVAELPAPAPFFLNSFFREIQTDDAEEICFDVEHGRHRLAPFVSPLVAGQVVHSKGFTTKTFRPAYVKDKRILNANRPLRRALGERIGGDAINPAVRLQLALTGELQDQLEMLTRRQEVMAIEALRTGKIIVSGDQYPTTEVDFQRDPALTRTLLGNSRWGKEDGRPLADVRAWASLIAQKSGARATTVAMDGKAWALFRADPEVERELARFRGTAQLNPAVAGEGGRHMGTVGDLDIWLYAGWYEDPDSGQAVQYLPDNTVIMTGPELEGVRAYGAIRDEEGGFQALPFFPKSWPGKDPGVRYLLMQSAPLPVPYRINASLCATVA